MTTTATPPHPSRQDRAGRPPNPAPSTAARIAAALFLIVVLFQVGLALGLPWGAAAFGGANPGVLPVELRTSSVVAALVYLLLAGVAGTRWLPTTPRRFVLIGAAVLMVIGALVNIASTSFIERIIWAPVTIALAVALWVAAQHPSLRPRKDKASGR